MGYLLLLALLLVGGWLTGSPDPILSSSFESADPTYDVAHWQPHDYVDGALQLTSVNRFPAITWSNLEIEPGAFDLLTIDLELLADVASEIHVYFGETNETLHRFEQRVQPGIQNINVPLGKIRGWSGPIRILRIDPVTDAGLKVRVDNVQLAHQPRFFADSWFGRIGLAAVAATAPVQWPLITVWALMWLMLMLKPPPTFHLLLHIFLLALVPRLLYGFLPLLDSLIFSDPALWKEHALGIWSAEKPRGYPYWGWGWQATLALLLGPSGGAALWPVWGFLSILSALTCVMTYLIARRLLPLRTALISAMLWAGLEEPIRFTGLLYGETFFTFMVVGFLWMSYGLAKANASRRVGLLMMFFSTMMILTRAQAVLLLPAQLIWLMLRREPAVALRRSSWSWAGLVLALLVSWPLAWKQENESIPLQVGVGLNLAIGHNPESEGMWQYPPEDWVEAAWRQNIGYKETDQFYRDKVVEYIRADPKALGLRSARKVVLALNPLVRRDWFYEPIFPLPMLPRWVVWALFPVGVVLCFRRLRLHALPLFHVFATFGLVVVFFFNERFLVPAMPIMCIYAGVAASFLVDRAAVEITKEDENETTDE